MPLLTDPNVLRGLETLDDAGVYKLRDDLAIIQTVDFFTPIVDNPYDFGQIAVANALSDVYSMGGVPITALNIVCFPVKMLDISVLSDILKGGIEKMREAGVILLGGHSVDDKELKYGLSITGTIDPKKMLTNSGAQTGDAMILTKPLGTGIINTALKAGMAKKETVTRVTASMATLNKKPAELMGKYDVHSCTDITGFGFAGHSLLLAQNSKKSLRIDSRSLPIFEEVAEFVCMGIMPGGLHRNKDFYSPKVTFRKNVTALIKDAIFDPQTSGGLLIVLKPRDAASLLKDLHDAGITDAIIVGEITDGSPGTMIVE